MLLTKIGINLILSLFFTVISVTSLAQTSSLQGSPYIKNYTSKEMGSSSQVWCCVQDKRGMLYVGDNNGILEFNGRDWKRIYTANRSVVRAMAIDKTGVIYVGGSDDFGYLKPNYLGSMVYVSLSQTIHKKGINFLDIWKVFVTSDGIYYFSNQNVFWYHENKITIIPVDFLVEDAYLINDKIYLPTKNGLFLITTTTLVKVSSKVGSQMTLWHGNEYLCFSKDGLLSTFNPQLNEIKTFKSEAQTFFKTNYIYNIARYDERSFIVTTETNKILILTDEGKIIRLIDASDGLISGFIYNVYVDADKNIWVCTSKGLSKVDVNFPMLKFGESNNISTNVISSILFKGKRYIGTIDGVYYLPKFDLLNHTESKKFVKIKSIHEACWKFIEFNEHLYAICSLGIWIINNDNARLIYEINSPLNAYCSSTNPKFSNQLFVGMMGKVVALTVDNSKDANNVKVVSEMTFPGITEIIRSIISDDDGNLWINTQMNAVYFVRFINGDLQNFRITLLGTRNGISNLKNTHCYKVNGKILLSTETGIYEPIFPPNKNLTDSLIRYQTSSYFKDLVKEPYAIITKVSEDKYLISGEIAYFTEMKKGKISFDTCGFGRLNFEFENISISNDSFICFPSPDGLFYYNLKNKRNFKKPFNTLISKVILEKDSILFDGSFISNVNNLKVASLIQNTNMIPELNYAFNSLTIHYSGLFFEDPERTEFQHQLIGFDSSWSDWSVENKSHYTNLAKGEYNFIVRARNVYGVISMPASYKFIILSPWYTSWWAYFLYIFLFVLFIYLLLKYYNRSLLQQKSILEKIVSDRTIEIAEQANELKQINEKLVEMDKFKQGITSMIVHDLKNPINAIINSPESDLVYQFKRVKQTGKQMLNLVLNILDVYKFEESKIVVNSENIPLYNIVSKSTEQVLFLSNEKEIKISNCVRTNLTVNADREMIERVIVNLLTNAIKYTPNNGKIIINAEQLKNQRNDSFVKVLISDNGIGIDSDNAKLVFQKFGQVNAKSSGSVRSTGLGLTYCKMVVEAHSGEINVESELGKGSTFWFTIPGFYEKTIKIASPTSDDLENPQHNVLSEENQQLVRDCLLELQNTEIYKISELTAILKKIDEKINPEIKDWKKGLIKAIDTGNEYMYNKYIFKIRTEK